MGKGFGIKGQPAGFAPDLVNQFILPVHLNQAFKGGHRFIGLPGHPAVCVSHSRLEVTGAALPPGFNGLHRLFQMPAPPEGIGLGCRIPVIPADGICNFRQVAYPLPRDNNGFR